MTEMIYTATTGSPTVHKVFDLDNGFGQMESYTLCDARIPHQVTKTADPVTCKRCKRAKA